MHPPFCDRRVHADVRKWFLAELDSILIPDRDMRRH